MIEKKERIVWVVALLTLLGVMGFNYYKTHEHDEALALIADPPTAYDTPIIPETANEKELREFGLFILETGTEEERKKLLDFYFGLDEDQFGLPYHGGLRANSYLLAQYLLAMPESVDDKPFLHDPTQAAMAYLITAVRRGYAPARDLYNKQAAIDLKQSLKLFREEQYNEAWKLLLPLAAEGYPPAVKKAANITSYYVPIGECVDAYWNIRDAKKGDTHAMKLVADMIRGNGMRHNAGLAYAWEIKAWQLQGKTEKPLHRRLSEQAALKIEKYALATPVDQLPLGEPLVAPPLPLNLRVESETRVYWTGMLCFENAVLDNPLGPPVDNPDSHFDKEYYQMWLRALKDPQD